jgi:hypothetical protein
MSFVIVLNHRQFFRNHGGSICESHLHLLHGKSSRLTYPGLKHNSGHIFDRRPFGHYSVRLDLCFLRISWYSGKLSKDLRCLSNSGGRLLLVSYVEYSTIRFTRELGHRVAHFSWELDRNFEYQLLRCSVGSFCHYRMGRLFCGKSVANGSCVLGNHGRSICSQCIWCRVSRPDRQSLHILDVCIGNNQYYIGFGYVG